MANAAEQMGSVADYGFHVAQKLQEAQETVDVKMGEVGIDKLEADAHAAMGKATTPEQMQDIQRGFEEKAQEAVNSQKNPKVSRALQFYGAHKSIGIQDLATVRQAKVITENDLAANDMLGTKYSGDYVLAAAAGGDTTMAENDERILLASSVKHGTMTQDQADAHFDKWLKDSKMDTIGALANSPKPADRQAVIAQLKSGNGPLVDGMNLAERNTTLTAAEHEDHELTEMAGAQDLRGVLNNMHDAFEKFPYTNNGKGDYEARENAVDDGDFLKSIGAVTPDGKPDRVMGEKLQQEVTRQRAEWEKEQSDKDQKILSKYVPNVMKMSESQVTSLGEKEGLSPRGISSLEIERKRQVNEATDRGRSAHLYAMQMEQATSEQTLTRIRLGLEGADLPTPTDLLKMVANKKLTYRDMKEAQSDIDKWANDPAIAPALHRFKSTILFPAKLSTKTTPTDAEVAQYNTEWAKSSKMATEAWGRFSQLVKQHPDEDSDVLMQQALKPVAHEQVKAAIDKTFGTTAPPPPELTADDSIVALTDYGNPNWWDRNIAGRGYHPGKAVKFYYNPETKKYDIPEQQYWESKPGTQEYEDKHGGKAQ